MKRTLWNKNLSNISFQLCNILKLQTDKQKQRSRHRSQIDRKFSGKFQWSITNKCSLAVYILVSIYPKKIVICTIWNFQSNVARRARRTILHIWSFITSRMNVDISETIMWNSWIVSMYVQRYYCVCQLPTRDTMAMKSKKRVKTKRCVETASE